MPSVLVVAPNQRAFTPLFRERPRARKEQEVEQTAHAVSHGDRAAAEDFACLAVMEMESVERATLRGARRRISARAISIIPGRRPEEQVMPFGRNKEPRRKAFGFNLEFIRGPFFHG